MRSDEPSESMAGLYELSQLWQLRCFAPLSWFAIPLARSLMSVGLVTDPRGPLAQLRRRF